MQAVLALLIFVPAGYIAWCFLAIPFSWSRRRMRLRRAGLGFIALIAMIVAFNMNEDREARGLGFTSAADKHQATAQGIPDARTWKLHNDALSAQQASADVAAAAAAATARTEADKARAEREAREEADAKAAAAAAEVEQVAAAKAAADKAKDDDARCRLDIHCWGEKAWSGATVRCPALIEKLAKWDFQWTDGWTEPKFGSYRWKDQKRGVVTMVGDKAKMQNGFGAWKHVTYTCDYDPATDTVLGVQAY